MRLKFLSIFAAVLLITGCSTSDQSGGDGAGDSGTMTAQQELVSIGDRVFFDTDSYRLRSDAQATLRQQAPLITTRNLIVTIEGHADERGTREYNLALGDRRANAVREFLVGLGVSPSQVRTISYGKERPDALGHNETAWSQNRRGVTVITSAGS
ncbi:MAG: peptidoglycan-associated lipoprotein Pal [Magnetospiraceae bacterium]